MYSSLSEGTACRTICDYNAYEMMELDEVAERKAWRGL